MQMVYKSSELTTGYLFIKNQVYFHLHSHLYGSKCVMTLISGTSIFVDFSFKELSIKK